MLTTRVFGCRQLLFVRLLRLRNQNLPLVHGMGLLLDVMVGLKLSSVIPAVDNTGEQSRVPSNLHPPQKQDIHHGQRTRHSAKK